MSGDWIKLHRKLLASPIMQHAGLTQLWVYCLARANWKPVKWLVPGTLKEINIPRGSFISGRESLHAVLYPKTDSDGRPLRREWTPTSKTLWNWMQALENMKCVKLENVSNRCTLVTVCKYESYQNQESSDFPQASRRLPAGFPQDDQPASTNKEDKKLRREEREQAEPLSPIERHEASFASMTPGFDEFMAEYPNKTKIARAKEAWRRQVASAGIVMAVMAGLHRWKASQQWADGKIELAANFLDDQLFNEFPIAAGRNGKPESPQETETERAEKYKRQQELLKRLDSDDA